MSKDYWKNKLSKQYGQEEWSSKPSLFAESIVSYLPKSGRLLELGAGVGQDSQYFASLGYEVTATDQTTDLLIKLRESCEVKELDMRESLPFSDGSFDIVYAHLSLHYFDEVTTNQVFAEIYRVLAPGGILAFLMNSKSDPEYGQGEQIETDYFAINGITKRYLDTEAARNLTNNFKPLLLDDAGETYKDNAMGVHNLIRYVGKKIDLV